ncbi:hypothetical protein ABXW19_11900, partial [Streptococcus suis]|uniref:hypothetical protein n=1 Tax=Streptococcus suis TaxID=1307 RepID=UPI003CF5F354
AEMAKRRAAARGDSDDTKQAHDADARRSNILANPTDELFRLAAQAGPQSSTSAATAAAAAALQAKPALTERDEGNV